MLSLYRAALDLRRQRLVGHDDPLHWLASGVGVLAFRRGATACVVNLSSVAVAPPDGAVLLASGALEGGLLPPDTAAWIEVSATIPEQ